jgi:hypothetical protein
MTLRRTGGRTEPHALQFPSLPNISDRGAAAFFCLSSFVFCLLSFVFRRSSFVVRCSLFVVRRSLFVFRWELETLNSAQLLVRRRQALFQDKLGTLYSSTTSYYILLSNQHSLDSELCSTSTEGFLSFMSHPIPSVTFSRLGGSVGPSGIWCATPIGRPGSVAPSSSGRLTISS